MLADLHSHRRERSLQKDPHAGSKEYVPGRLGVFFSVALSVASPRPAVSRYLALWSPDFPH